MKEACENRILVTRGFGFIGTNLADALIGTVNRPAFSGD